MKISLQRRAISTLERNQKSRQTEASRMGNLQKEKKNRVRSKPNPGAGESPYMRRKRKIREQA